MSKDYSEIAYKHTRFFVEECGERIAGTAQIDVYKRQEQVPLTIIKAFNYCCTMEIEKHNIRLSKSDPFKHSLFIATYTSFSISPDGVANAAGRGNTSSLYFANVLKKPVISRASLKYSVNSLTSSVSM